MRTFDYQNHKKLAVVLLILLLGMSMLACAEAENSPQFNMDERITSFSSADLLGIRHENGDIYISCISEIPNSRIAVHQIHLVKEIRTDAMRNVELM